MYHYVQRATTRWLSFAAIAAFVLVTAALGCGPRFESVSDGDRENISRTLQGLLIASYEGRSSGDTTALRRLLSPRYVPNPNPMMWEFNPQKIEAFAARTDSRDVSTDRVEADVRLLDVRRTSDNYVEVTFEAEVSIDSTVGASDPATTVTVYKLRAGLDYVAGSYVIVHMEDIELSLSGPDAGIAEFPAGAAPVPLQLDLSEPSSTTVKIASYCGSRGAVYSADNAVDYLGKWANAYNPDFPLQTLQ